MEALFIKALPAILSAIGSFVGTVYYMKANIEENKQKLHDLEMELNEHIRKYNTLDKLMAKIIVLHRVNHPENPEVRNGE